MNHAEENKRNNYRMTHEGEKERKILLLGQAESILKELEPWPKQRQFNPPLK